MDNCAEKRNTEKSTVDYFEHPESRHKLKVVEKVIAFCIHWIAENPFVECMVFVQLICDLNAILQIDKKEHAKYSDKEVNLEHFILVGLIVCKNTIENQGDLTSVLGKS